MSEFWAYIIGIIAVLIASLTVAVLIRRGKIEPDVGREISDSVIDLVREAEVKWQGYEKAGADKKAWVMEQLKAAYNFIANTATVGKLVDSMVAVFNALDLW